MNAATASFGLPPGVQESGGPGRHPLELGDYVAEDGGLQIRHETIAGYADPAPGSLFVHPTWLRTYGTGAIVVVEGLRPGVPRLVFARERGGLVHRGRLFRMQAALIVGLTERLPAATGAAFTVFEDMEVVGALPKRLLQLAFHYQNNWRLDLRDPAWMSKQLVGTTKRKARGLRRELPDVSIRFEAAPGRPILDRIAAFGRARIEAQGRRYGIDAVELDRLAAVADAAGHGTRVQSGDAVLAADLIGIVGDQAYFLTHGFDPGHARSRLGMVCLVNSIEACAARGVRDFNMLWGDLPYKAQLGAGRVPLRTVVACRSWAGAGSPGFIAAVLRFGGYDLKRRLKPLVARMRARLRSPKDIPKQTG